MTDEEITDTIDALGRAGGEPGNAIERRAKACELQLLLELVGALHVIADRLAAISRWMPGNRVPDDY